MVMSVERHKGNRTVPPPEPEPMETDTSASGLIWRPFQDKSYVET